MSEAVYIVNRYGQDKTEVLDYDIDWTNEIPAGDSIPNGASSTWSVSPVGPNITTPAPSLSGLVSKVWFSAPTAAYGAVYDVTNKVTTAAGRVLEATIRITINDR